MAPKTPSPGTEFEKVLRAFGTGGFTYTYVLAQLNRLLETGASPTELVEILRRRELIAPLPEYAHVKVLSLLNEAKRRAASHAAVSNGGAQNADSDTAPELTLQSPPGPTRPAPMAPPPHRAQDLARGRTVALTSLLEKLLSTLETSAFTDTDVLAQLKRLLRATGTSPTELREALRRRELIEPLSEYAYVEVLGLLNAAIARAAAQAAEVPEIASPPPDEDVPIDLDVVGSISKDYSRGATARMVSEFVRPSGPDMTARASALATGLAAARVALESEQKKTRELNQALAESIASTEAAIARSAEALRESEGYQSESRALHDSLAARDAEFEALQAEHAKLLPALEAREKTGQKLETDLQAARASATALATDLTAAKNALESEQDKARKLDQALADSIAAAKAARSASEEARRESEFHQTESHTLHDALAAREAELAALRKEHSKIVPALEARTKTGQQLEEDLLAARARVEEITSELKASQEAADRLNAEFKRSKSQLNSVRAELDAVKAQSSSYLELLRTRDWRRGFDQNDLRELDERADAAHAESGARSTERDQLMAQVASLQAKLEAQDELIRKMRMTVNADAARAAESQAAAEVRESEQVSRFAQLNAQQSTQQALQRQAAEEAQAFQAARAARAAKQPKLRESRKTNLRRRCESSHRRRRRHYATRQ